MCLAKGSCSSLLGVGGQLNKGWREQGLLESSGKHLRAAKVGERQLLKDEVCTVEVHYAGRSIQAELFSFLIQLPGGEAQQVCCGGTRTTP